MANVQRANDTDKARQMTADEMDAAMTAIVEEVFRLQEGRKKLGAPKGFGDVVDRARLEDEDIRFQRTTLNPLRRKALACVAKLNEALRQVVDAEAKLPSRLKAERWAGVAASLAKPEGSSTSSKAATTTAALPEADREAQMRLLLMLGEPAFVLKWLPALIAHLNGPLTRSRRGPGRPRSVTRVVQEAAKKAGLGDRRIGRLLKLEGLDDAVDAEALKARARARRREKGSRREKQGGTK
jgi:hypothetical protein